MPFQQKFRQSAEEETATVGYSRSAPGSFHRSWPDTVAFREAIQQPESVFADALLKQANVSLDRRGLPVAYSGRFAIVFRLNGTNGERWAVRCFTSGIDADERRSRYYLIARHIDDLGDVVVPFRYIDRGICVGGEWFPVLAMPWVPGEPLGRFVERNLQKPEALRRLAGVLTALLLRLEAAGIAHGDWQHDNLLVGEGGEHVTLVDYDGMFVPEFAGRYCPEAGHPNYQHPFRTADQFGVGLDRFSCLVVQTALLALADDPDLWSRFSDGESLLFRKSDFLSPGTSLLFATLRETAVRCEDTLLAESIACLEDACRSGVEATLQPVVPAIEGKIPARPNPVPINAAAPTGNGSATMSAASPWYTVNASGKKWWQEETVTLGISASAAGARTRTSATPHEQFTFIDRLSLPETLVEERKNLWHARIVVPLAAALIGLSLYWIAARAHFFPFYVFFWMFNLGNIGYARWPRRKVFDELNAEIQKMQKLIEGRQEMLARSLAQLGLNAGNMPDFVANTLRKRTISMLVHQPYGLTASTLTALNRVGIENASQLQHRIDVPNVTAAEMRQIHLWVSNIVTEAQDEYRRTTGSQTAAANDMNRLRDEIGQFEREIDRLQREKDAFPECSFSAYLRRLVGLEAASGPASATSP
jgi:hypothetical protein